MVAFQVDEMRRGVDVDDLLGCSVDVERRAPARMPLVPNWA